MSDRVVPPEVSGRTAEAAVGRGGRLADLVLSADPRQRIRISRSLLSAQVYLALAAINVFAVLRDVVPAYPLMAWHGALALWVLAVYIVLRSGLNQRFTDPALTLAQVIGAEVWIVGGYAMCAPFRGVMLTLLALVLVFGIFRLDPAGRRVSMAWALTLLGAVMVWKTHAEPQAYPLDLEIIHFAVIATILPVVSMLGAQLSGMQAKLKQQKRDLSEALVRIQELATRDSLTGLYNRRHMSDLIGHAVNQVQRSNQSFTLCLIDLDDFKRINDSHGHRVGDEVLASFAALARQTLRAPDVASRWGGEEFLLLLPLTHADEALVSMQRLRALWADTTVSKQMPRLRVTFSAGLAEYVRGENPDDAIERADQALYEAKQAGRNRIVVSGVSPRPSAAA